jgi:hypothetical protein
MTASAFYRQDETFFAALARGRRVELAIATELLDAGLWVKAGRAERRHDLADADRFRNEVDLAVAIRRQLYAIEVRERPELDFTDDPASFPYPTLIVTDVEGYERETDHAYATVIVSKSGGKLVVPGFTRPLWKRVDTYDRRIGRERAFFELDRAEALPWPWLIAHLTELEATR